MKDNNIRICRNCLTLGTRPRVEFDELGFCNACNWAIAKKHSIDWKARTRELKKLCGKYRRNDGYWDVLVPCSGGKDSAYIAWKMKHELGMKPLLVTLQVPMQTDIGGTALNNLIDTGFDHVNVKINPVVYKKFCKWAFINEGRPKMPFEIGISLVTMKIAINMGIPFIMYGEEGEEEYGGATTQIGNYKITRKYLMDYYYNGHNPVEYERYFDRNDLVWWRLPSEKELQEADLFPTHWSHFENWDSLLHYEYLRDKYDFPVSNERQVGTFVNYAQLDDKVQDLHAYLMWIKFGFGRCWSDACIEIRAGRMTRYDGIKMVKKYDGEFPCKYLDDYLKFFDMGKKEFFDVIDKWRGKDVWEKKDGKWSLKEIMFC